MMLSIGDFAFCTQFRMNREDFFKGKAESDKVNL
jgi:hypothetical protein